jgi:hypothetical protein
MWITSVTINYPDFDQELKQDRPAWQIIRLIAEVSERRPRPTSMMVTLVWRDK